MAATAGFFCNISREMLSGRSWLSMTPAHEPQIAGHQVGVVADEDAADVQLDATLAGGVVEVERLRCRREQQHRVFAEPFRPVVESEGGVVERPQRVAIELGEFLRAHVAA